MKSTPQICNGRLAFQGSLRAGKLDDPGNHIEDLTIIDIKTGNIILSCLKDLGFSCVKNFFIQKENLIFENQGQIVLAKFWV